MLHCSCGLKAHQETGQNALLTFHFSRCVLYRTDMLRWVKRTQEYFLRSTERVATRETHDVRYFASTDGWTVVSDTEYPLRIPTQIDCPKV